MQIQFPYKAKTCQNKSDQKMQHKRHLTLFLTFLFIFKHCECVNKFVIKCFWLFKCISMNAHLMITSVLSITNLSSVDQRVLTSLSLYCKAHCVCLHNSPPSFSLRVSLRIWQLTGCSTKMYKAKIILFQNLLEHPVFVKL